MGRRGIRNAIARGAAGAVVVLSGCRSTVFPPPDPVDPVSVFLVDYGRHSSLVLPVGDDHALTEYAYGDWAWYALDESAWYDVLPTLFWPTPGALGRRVLPVAPDAESVRRYASGEQVLEITVGGADASALAAELGRRFDEHVDTLHYQPLHDLSFVRDERAFHAFSNCNSAVAGWLRACGCEVRGATIFANFELRAPTGSSSARTGARAP